MAALIDATDWSKSSLGPRETWPHSLATILRIMVTSRYQMWMAWGRDLTFFYNDAYAPTLGKLLLLAADHTLMHAAQFSVVRRKLGKPIVF